MANHLTLGIYANGQCTHNIVKEEDLENHIRYNKIFRFGRFPKFSCICGESRTNYVSEGGNTDD